MRFYLVLQYCCLVIVLIFSNSFCHCVPFCLLWMCCYFDLQSIPKMLIKQCEEKVIREQQHMNIFILKKIRPRASYTWFILWKIWISAAKNRVKNGNKIWEIIIAHRFHYDHPLSVLLFSNTVDSVARRSGDKKRTNQIRISPPRRNVPYRNFTRR